MVAARTRLEIATENLANVSTDGFRRVGAHGFLTKLGVSISREPAPQSDRLRAGNFTSNGVDAIAEMVDVLAAERSFESAEKAVAAIDLSRQKAAQAAHIT